MNFILTKLAFNYLDIKQYSYYVTGIFFIEMGHPRSLAFGTIQVTPSFLPSFCGFMQRRPLLSLSRPFGFWNFCDKGDGRLQRFYANDLTPSRVTSYVKMGSGPNRLAEPIQGNG